MYFSGKQESTYGAQLKIEYKVAGKTDKGLVREGNEDFFKINQDQNLFIVCDGMGGHQAGEVASKEACEVVEYCFTNLADRINSRAELDLSDKLPVNGDLLVKSIRIANRSIYIRSRSSSSLSGMGTTIVAMALDEGLINIAHAGDSRAYRFYDEKLTRLTTDHSWVTELQNSGNMTEEEANQIAGKNVITRALGVNERVDIDYRADRLTDGEIYILCSDGLCGFAEDEEIQSVVADCDNDVDKIVKSLVQLGNDHGGQDNITVVALKIDHSEVSEDTSVYPPVTVSKENDEAITVENEIVNAILDLKKSLAAGEEEKTEVIVEQGGSKLPLIFIFVLFIIVAAVFIYFSLGK